MTIPLSQAYLSAKDIIAWLSSDEVLKDYVLPDVLDSLDQNQALEALMTAGGVSIGVTPDTYTQESAESGGGRMSFKAVFIISIFGDPVCAHLFEGHNTMDSVLDGFVQLLLARLVEYRRREDIAPYADLKVESVGDYVLPPESPFSTARGKHIVLSLPLYY